MASSSTIESGNNGRNGNGSGSSGFAFRSSSFPEGLSANRPPYLTGDNYPLWKLRMQSFLMGHNMSAWCIIEDGFTAPDGKTSTWTAEQKEKCSANEQAKSLLYCAISQAEFERVSTCKSAKDIWEKLKVTHEGTSQVKETRMNILMREYELFSMLPNESITEMNHRFTKIVNALKGLGKVITEKEEVQKILRSLPKAWIAKVTAIEEAKDISTLKIDDLIGSLLSHEHVINKNEPETKGKRSVGLKATSDQSDVDAGEEDDEIAMLTRRFKRFLQTNNKMKNRFAAARRVQNKKTDRKPKAETSFKKEEEEVTCHNCGGKGHLMKVCPSVKKERKKRPQNFGAWCDSDSSISVESESENEECHVGLMAHDDEDKESHTSDEVSYEDFLFELQKEHTALLEESTLITEKYANLKKECQILQEAILRLQLEIRVLNDECSDMTTENNLLKESSKKLFDENQKLEQCCATLKCTIKQLEHRNMNQLHYSNWFRRKTFSPHNQHCHFCNKFGHVVYNCNMRKLQKYGMKLIWVPKSSVIIPDKHGPKMWVPKT